MPDTATVSQTSSTPPPAALAAHARHAALLNGINLAIVALKTIRARLNEEVCVEHDFESVEDRARETVADACAHLTEAADCLNEAKSRVEGLLTEVLR